MKHIKTFWELLSDLISSDDMRKKMDEIDNSIEEDRNEGWKKILKKLRQLDGEEYLNNL